MCTCDETNHSPTSDGDENDKRNAKRLHDKNFKGPIKSGRGCTDVICCIIFLLVLIGEAVVAYFAFTQGDPKILLAPTDSAGNLCGTDPNVANKPNLIFFDIWQCARMGPAVVINGCPTPQVCVAECPTETFTFLQLLPPLGSDTSTNRAKYLVCKEGVDIVNTDTKTLIQNQLCAPYTLNSTALFGRCLPTLLFQAVDLAGSIANSVGNEIKNADNTTMTYQLIQDGSKYLAIFMNSQEIAKNVLSDVIAAWWLIVVGFGIGVIISFVWCILMRFVTGCIIWISIIGFFLAFAGSSAYCFYQYYFNANAQGNFQFTTNLNSYLGMKYTWLVLGIISLVFMAIFFLIIVCLRSRIRLAVAIIKESSKAVAAIMTTLIFPLIPWIIELACIAFWLVLTVYLAATGKKQFVQTNLTALATVNGSNEMMSTLSSSCSPNNITDLLNGNKMLCQFATYAGNNWAIYLQLYNLFVCLWMLAFTIGFGQIVLAGVFASWYWAWEKPKDVPAFPIAASLWRSVRYHIGTVAFGSFLIAVIWFIRVILEYIERQTKQSQNILARVLICCCKCCLWCLEKCLRFLTKNAYINTAIYGFNFCHAAIDVFWLILRNIARVATINCVTGFILLIGKFLVTGLTFTAAFFFFNGTLANSIPYLKSLTPTLNYFFVPVIIIAIGTYLVATIFFDVYDFAVDTLFICVMEDLERNDGSVEKPYFMSKNLMKVLDVKNKFKEGDPSAREGCCLCCC